MLPGNAHQGSERALTQTEAAVRPDVDANVALMIEVTLKSFCNGNPLDRATYEYLWYERHQTLLNRRALLNELAIQQVAVRPQWTAHSCSASIRILCNLGAK